MKEVITPDRFQDLVKKLEELLVASWYRTSPISPKMILDISISPIELYFSTVGRIWWKSPFWRGEAFTVAVLLHELYHWSIFPVDAFRALKELIEARRLLAKEEGFTPQRKIVSPWRTEEDWSKFRIPLPFFQLVQNILGDYLINMHIKENHPSVWRDFWDFLFKEGTLYLKEKALPRDSTFHLYLAAYHYLDPSLDKIQLKEKETEEKAKKIADIVRKTREKRISTVYALKELVKIFAPLIQKDQEEGVGEGEGELKCPKCGSEEWQISAYEKEDGTWEEV